MARLRRHRPALTSGSRGAWCDDRSGRAGLGASAGATRAGHPRHREPGPPRPECERGNTAALLRGNGPARPTQSRNFGDDEAVTPNEGGCAGHFRRLGPYVFAAPPPQSTNSSVSGHGSSAEAGRSAHTHQRWRSSHFQSARQVRLPSSSRSMRTRPPPVNAWPQVGQMGSPVGMASTVRVVQATVGYRAAPRSSDNSWTSASSFSRETIPWVRGRSA